MEARYTNRFRGLGEKTGAQIKNRDAAGNLPERLANAKGSISSQHDNIRDLISTATEVVTGVNTHQQMMGVELVKNIPLPTEEIMASPSLKLGYVQLTMRFMQAGLIHFMEEVQNAQYRITEMEKMIEQLAQHDEDIDIIGRIKPLDLDALENNREQALPPSPPKSVTSSSSVTDEVKTKDASSVPSKKNVAPSQKRKT